MPEEGRLVFDVGGRNDSDGEGGGEEEEVLDEHGFDVLDGDRIMRHLTWLISREEVKVSGSYKCKK